LILSGAVVRKTFQISRVAEAASLMSFFEDTRKFLPQMVDEIMSKQISRREKSIMQIQMYEV
jgi:predicted anti-sigma-YlaC factor YlaD